MPCFHDFIQRVERTSYICTHCKQMFEATAPTELDQREHRARLDATENAILSGLYAQPHKIDTGLGSLMNESAALQRARRLLAEAKNAAELRHGAEPPQRLEPRLRTP